MAAKSPIWHWLQRKRQPGDLVFAVVFCLGAVVLLSQIGSQTLWTPRAKQLPAQPVFWPAISLAAMVIFSVLHLASTLVSPRLPGRWREVAVWLRSLEFAVWFLVYVKLTPLIGYMPATLLFALLLSLRCGYHRWRQFGPVMLVGLATVLIFKSFLQVKIPGGAAYDLFPPGVSTFFYSYL